MEMNEVYERFQNVGLKKLNPRHYGDPEEIRMTAIEKGAREFKRRFGGFFNLKTRSESETLRVIQDVGLVDNPDSARKFLESMVGELLTVNPEYPSHTGGDLYTLERVQNKNGEVKYRIKSNTWID